MELPRSIVKQFVSVTNDNTKSKNTDNTAYGEIVKVNGHNYVKIDGSDMVTPYSATANVKAGDRVVVTIKNHTATVMGNTTDPSASSAKVTEIDTTVQEFDSIYAKTAVIEDLYATKATIENLYATNATVEKLQASIAEIDDLYATNATVEKLEATIADIDDLYATKATVGQLEATIADIDTLYAKNATVGLLQADVAGITTLIFGSASGDTIQTSFSNSVISQLGDAQIKSAMIDSVSASKITAGSILTNNVTVTSEDGNLVISDETIQIKDENRVRVQIGKDAANDYSINLWDKDGNLMFSEGGITDHAVKDAIIRNDMISDTANISAGKLDISSLFTAINNDGSNTLKASKVYLDDEKQTLEVSFKKMTTDVGGVKDAVTSQGTKLDVIQDQITSKVWKQDIDTAKGEMNTAYTQLSQTVDGISGTVAKHTTDLANKADVSTVTNLTQEANSFKAEVKSTYTTKEDFSNLDIGGRNLLENSSFRHDRSGWIVAINGESAPADAVEYVTKYGRECAHIKHTELGMRTTIYQNLITQNGDGERVTKLEPDTEYILSGSVLTENIVQGTTDFFCRLYTEGMPDNFSIGSVKIPINTGVGAWTRIQTTLKTDSAKFSGATSLRVYIYARDFTGDLYFSELKLEKGDKATDWTAAPEDAARASDMADAIEDLDKKNEELRTYVDTQLNILNGAISQKVETSEDGFLVVTTAEGTYHIDISDIKANDGELRKAIDTVTGKVKDIDPTKINESIEALEENTAWIKQGTNGDGDPCITLGKGDSDFKLEITNDEIAFKEGSDKVAYISDDRLFIKRASVVEELNLGKFTWKFHGDNDNLGLIYEG